MLLLLQIREIASRYQLHTSLPSQRALHIRQKFQWTYEQLKSAYLDLQYFHRRSSKFHAEHLSLLLEWFTPYSSCAVFWVSSFHLSVNIMVLQHFTVPGHVYRKLRILSWSMKSLASRLRLCFRVVDDVPEKKGMDLWKQMSSSKCSFTCICRIFLPLKPSTSTVYARSAFYPSLHSTLSLQSAFYTQSAFHLWSAVCSPQSAVRSPHWPVS